jgi:hypothetical protein
MSSFENRTGRKARDGVKALLERGASILPRTRDAEGDRRELEEAHQKIATKDKEIAELQAQLAQRDASNRGSGIRPENIIWIFGSGRTGSTWLSRMMGELTDGPTVWNEPWVGHVFHAAIEESKRRGRKGKGFILASHYRRTWLRSIKAFVLDGAAARFPEMSSGDHLVIKEPGGSIGAPLLMEALPESRMTFLVRDPRDVVASQADAHREGSWMSSGRGPDASSVERARRAANIYLRNIEKAKQAYESHDGRKVLVRYEELRADTLATMKRIYSTLEIPVEEKKLAQAVEKHSWENIPEEEKGSGKIFRKATPGGWREDLTSEQIEAVQRITAPFLEEFYPKNTLLS